MRPSPSTTRAGVAAHPPEARLVLFMLQKLPQPEALPVVRHLLTGCPRCLTVTRRLWDLGERRTDAV
jgi:hypothetical protein